jgi:hypothetical protein
MAVIPLDLHGLPAGADAGVAVGGGVSPGAEVAAAAYQLAVVLPGDGVSVTAKVIVVDPLPFIRGSAITGVDAGAGDVLAPGSLAPCPILSAIELSGNVPATTAQGPAWPDGVPYVDGGVDAGVPSLGATCSSGTSSGGADAGSGADAGTDASTPSTPSTDAGAPDSGITVSTGPLVTRGIPHATAAAIDGTTFYIADGANPIIHVIDLSNPLAPREFSPLLVTSTSNPTATLTAIDIAVSPTTSDFKRYLYAIDSYDGSIIVYDITDPETSPRIPLTRPHAELDPFHPSDRIAFSAPAASVSFVRHDFALQKAGNTELSQLMLGSKTGIICNPNPNIILGSPPAQTSAALATTNFTASDVPDDVDLGVFYRSDIPSASETASTLPPGPARLRGVFAFATLTNGQVVAIDVDDWDGPCRRPDPLDSANQMSSVGPGEVAVPGSDDPYQAPLTYQGGSGSPVTDEEFFPVSAPHRERSLYYLDNDPVNGVHVPQLVGEPQLFASTTPLAVSGVGAEGNPIMLPTATPYFDPSYTSNPTNPNPSARVSTNSMDPTLSIPALPGAATTNAVPNVRFAWEDPTTQIDQNWVIDYEGIIPGYEGFSSTVNTTDAWQTLRLGNPQTAVAMDPINDAGFATANYCHYGVEDFRVGQARADGAISAASAIGITYPTGFDQKVADYVQLADDLLNPLDPYWTEPNSCWDPSLSNATLRYNACFQQFGNAVDQSVQRDFPIIEAYDDHFILGRYGYPNNEAPSTDNRTVVTSDPSNAPFLKEMQCCFHNQITYHVRTGGIWSAVGSVIGFMTHVKADAATNACVVSCDPRDALLNSRAIGIPRPTMASSLATPPDRNSILAMRNPMFAITMWNGIASGMDVTPVRDTVWKFTTRGEFVPLTVNLAASSTAVSPRSMRFIDSLGELAIVDGSGQGLVLINLDTVAQVASYF